MPALMKRLRKPGLDVVLAAAAGLLLALFIFQGLRWAAAGTLGRELADASVAAERVSERSGVEPVEEYGVIKDNEHFGKQKPPPKPQLFGVLGDTALIGTSPNDIKPYEAGAGLPGEMKLVEILGDSVVVEDKDGKKQTLTVFPPLGAPGGPGQGPPPRQPGPSGGKERPAGPPEAGKPEPRVQPPPARQSFRLEGGRGGMSRVERREEAMKRIEEMRRSGEFGGREIIIERFESESE